MSSVYGAIKLTPRNANFKNVMNDSDVIAVKVLEDNQIGCEHFATISNMWSSRLRKSFVSLTLHNLNDTFNIKLHT